MLGCIGAGTLRILEHEGAVEADFLDERQGELLVFLSLVVVAHKDICRDAATRNDALDGGYLVQIFLTCVLAVHELQNLVASALGREVDMFTEVGLFGYGLQDVLCHVFGVGSGKSYAHIGHGLCHHVQQLGKGQASFLALA